MNRSVLSVSNLETVYFVEDENGAHVEILHHATGRHFKSEEEYNASFHELMSPLVVEKEVPKLVHVPELVAKISPLYLIYPTVLFVITLMLILTLRGV